MSIGILIPVFNDWASLANLLAGLDGAAPGTDERLSVLIVDDGSTEPMPMPLAPDVSHLAGVRVMPLKANTGHQRAIAAGIVELSRHGHDAVVVMDGDGEDRPEDVIRLIERHRAAPGAIIAAQRGKRTESAVFRLFYWAYKLFFRVLTGERIGFGNFMLIPAGAVESIVYNPHTPSNLAAAALRSRVPVIEMKADRGVRYAGKSKMRFSRLVAHGLTAISVYAEQVAARILMAGFTLMALCVAGIAAIVAVRLFTNWAVPGWATYTVVGLFIIFLQTAILCLMVTLNHPGGRADSRTLHADLVKGITILK